jgi:hypothetical protein
MSDQEDDRYLQYASRKNRGWGGEDMELQHKQTHDTSASASDPVAVDLSQFRNTQVGKGYQAKHVVRQRTVATEPPSTAATNAKPKRGEKSKSIDAASSSRKRSSEDTRAVEEGSKSKSKRQEEDDRLQRYLQCDALRQFRRELEKIVS